MGQRVYEKLKFSYKKDQIEKSLKSFIKHDENKVLS